MDQESESGPALSSEVTKTEETVQHFDGENNVTPLAPSIGGTVDIIGTDLNVDIADRNLESQQKKLYSGVDVNNSFTDQSTSAKLNEKETSPSVRKDKNIDIVHHNNGEQSKETESMGEVQDKTSRDQKPTDEINEHEEMSSSTNNLISNHDGGTSAAELNIKSNINLSPKCTGLSMLASEYASDDSDDSDSVQLVATDVNVHKQEYRNQVVDIDSDCSSSCEVIPNECVESVEGIAMDYNEDGEDIVKTKHPHKAKGEMLLDDLPPIQDLHITVPEEECIELGTVHSIVDQLVLVNSLPNSVLLDLDTVLFIEKGKRVLGEIFDVLGQVADPIYCVRFNSNDQIKDKGITVGEKVYVAPKTEHTQFVILSNLLKFRGSDASWENDIEPPQKYLDYSDDEQERLSRHLAKHKNTPVGNDESTKRTRLNLPSYNNTEYQNPQFERNNFSRNRPRGSGYHDHRNFSPRQRNTYNYDHTIDSWHFNNHQHYGAPPAPNQHQLYEQLYQYQGEQQGVMNTSITQPPNQPPLGYVLNPYAANPQPPQQ